jgi:hypothetical protein
MKILTRSLIWMIAVFTMAFVGIAQASVSTEIGWSNSDSQFSVMDTGKQIQLKYVSLGGNSDLHFIKPEEAEAAGEGIEIATTKTKPKPPYKLVADAGHYFDHRHSKGKRRLLYNSH